MQYIGKTIKVVYNPNVHSFLTSLVVALDQSEWKTGIKGLICNILNDQ